MSEDQRVFLRGLDSATYGLSKYRVQQRSRSRVRRKGTIVDVNDDKRGERVEIVIE